MFGGLWGADKPQPTPKDLIKEQKKSVRKSQREIDREMRNLEKQEKKLLGDIKKNAEKGNTGESLLINSLLDAHLLCQIKISQFHSRCRQNSRQGTCENTRHNGVSSHQNTVKSDSLPLENLDM